MSGPPKVGRGVPSRTAKKNNPRAPRCRKNRKTLAGFLLEAWISDKNIGRVDRIVPEEYTVYTELGCFLFSADCFPNLFFRDIAEFGAPEVMFPSIPAEDLAGSTSRRARTKTLPIGRPISQGLGLQLVRAVVRSPTPKCFQPFKRQ